MALVERLMKDSSEPEDRWISVHEFSAAASEIVNNRLTPGQVQTYYAMTPADLIDWNAVVTTIPPANQTAARALWVHGIHDIFILSRSRAPGYDTPGAVRTKLGI